MDHLIIRVRSEIGASVYTIVKNACKAANATEISG